MCGGEAREVYLLVDFWFVGHVVDEVEGDFATTPGGPLVVPPAPPHAIAAPVVVVEGAHSALRRTRAVIVIRVSAVPSAAPFIMLQVTSLRSAAMLQPS